MKPGFNNQRLAIVLVLSLGLAFFYATYNAINNIVAEQSRVQQQVISPVFKLVQNELLRPLYIAETFASSVDFTTNVSSAGFDEQALLDRLGEMAAELDLVFFVASELARKQYLSDGRTLDLVEGEVAWYFEAKERDRDFMADLGQVGDVHLFFDVKMTGADQEFLGYVGVGKSLQRFLATFDRYKQQFGYDFLFVNDREEIILSSLPELVVTDAYIPTLDSLDWFETVASGQHYHDSEIIDVDGEDFLVSEFLIEELGWKLLLLVPLQSRQDQITRSFFANALVAVFIVLVLASMVLLLTLLYNRNLEKVTETDLLTGLPNRAFAERRYEQLQKAAVALCAIVIDLDHFKAINDTHGHDAGDRVLKAAAEIFGKELRDEDILCRWGGEEFAMLIPANSVDSGIAIAERTRQNLEASVIGTLDTEVSVTASLGVAFVGSASDETLESILARADEAMYKAKQSGRNQVRVHGSD